MPHKTKIPVPFFQFASDLGNGAGNINANGDYSVTPERFIIRPPSSTDVLRINRAIAYIEDSGNFRVEGYGAQNNPLTNGINFTVERDGVPLAPLTAGRPVRSNGEWARYCYDATLLSFGAGNNAVAVRWTFTKGGGPIRLSGSENDEIVITFTDDLSFLVDHTYQFQGWLETQVY